MQRVTRTTKVDVIPAVPVGEGVGGFFTGGNPAGDPPVPATVPGYEWFNRVQEEICNVIEQAGLALDPADNTQLLQGIVAAIAAGTIIQGKHEFFIPVDYLKPRVTSPCGDIATLETAVNKGNFRYRAFDPSVAEYAQFPHAFPKSWDGATIEFKYKWSHPATTVNFGVAFALQAVSIGDNEAMDAAFGAAVTVADVGGTTNQRYWSDWSAPVTIAGAGLGEDQTFQIFRNVGDAGNTLAVDARLEGLRLRVNFDKGNDA